jgi:hypothetical protein
MGAVVPCSSSWKGQAVRPDSRVPRNLQINLPDEEILKAILRHVSLDDLEEARAVYDEALQGNRVAQFIVGMSLLKAKHSDAANMWLQLSAEQNFGPATHQLRKAS